MTKKLELPPAPASQVGSVKAWRQSVVIPTYDVGPPDRNPMFLERRVYQGSSGKVYPLPFHDRIAEQKVDRAWDALHLENEFVRVMVLPQLGGRIHVALDKTNGYDFVYRQDVIKPALVGLAGPWISGGVEFNWPQHHRPATFMPTDSVIEEHADGSRTLWCGDHDPMSRMKGMHGICLRPGRACVEIKVRLHNRTPLTQTFLWWTNIATRVHERYQSFFPTDVAHVADHARRASSRFPHCDGHYYGVDYAARARDGVPEAELPPQYAPPPGEYAADDLSWYANIPVPTSYMCVETAGDFLGGYDHAARAGIVHVADRHVSPGKKQWTWGNHEFGYAWDRNLTDADEHGEYRPYIELMAGVYTDNQPDFSFLAPGETKTFTQFLFPIQQIGSAKQANAEAAVNVSLDRGRVNVGVCVTAEQRGAIVRLHVADETFAEWRADLSPGRPLIVTHVLTTPIDERALSLRVVTHDGRELIAYAFAEPTDREPEPATEIAEPAHVATIDELYLSGLHLAQYRHATRRPEAYWTEALSRDPEDSRCNTAMGVWHFRRGEWSAAESHLRRALRRITRRNANPYDGEPLYHLGLTLRHLGRDDDAYAAFYKATWNAAWRTPAFVALAEIDCRRADWPAALEHLDRSLRTDVDHLLARDLKAIVLRNLGRDAEASTLIAATRALDPLDWLARHLAGEPLACDTQAAIDVALDLARAGLFAESRRVLERAAVRPDAGTAPLVCYHLGYTLERLGDADGAAAARRAASTASPDYCFPARLDEIEVLEAALRADPRDARAHYYLGTLLYDRRRYAEAMRHWEASAAIDPSFPTVWRNLGIARFNIARNVAGAADAYARATVADPRDARLLYERDQLAKRTGQRPDERLARLRKHAALVARRDDLSIEMCALLNLAGRHEEALELLRSRRFQPWEGGEGLALGQHVRTHLAIAKKLVRTGDPRGALTHLTAAARSPQGLGEAKHLLANQSDIHYWTAVAHEALGDADRAADLWTLAAEKRGDFIGMAVQPYSEMTYYSILSLRKLGREAEASRLLEGLTAHANATRERTATIDYFATSLPTMLLFESDLDAANDVAARLLLAQASLAADDVHCGIDLLREILTVDPNHAAAADLLADVSDREPPECDCRDVPCRVARE